MNQAIEWPAIVQFENNDELELVENLTDLNSVAVATDSRLISYSGAIYEISQKTSAAITLTDTHSTLSISDAVLIAQKHMATQDQCCVSKFHARTVKEVIDALLASDDN